MVPLATNGRGVVVNLGLQNRKAPFLLFEVHDGFVINAPVYKNIVEDLRRSCALALVSRYSWAST